MAADVQKPTDLVALLREGAQRIDIDGTPSQVGPSSGELRETADEIERLRAALQRIADTGPPAEYERIARKALRHG